MSTYRLYKSPTGDVVRVKLGFSWQAFFVGSLSAIVRRTWLLAAVGFLFYVVSAYVSGAPASSSRTVALALALLGFYGVYMVFCGINASRWLGDSLRRRGYSMVGEERSGFWKRGRRAGTPDAKSYSH
ncbi:MAG: hypothetical protein ABI641_08110 [Caldimonas sp.]